MQKKHKLRAKQLGRLKQYSKTIVQKLAKEKNLIFVVDKKAAFFLQPEHVTQYDLTPEVLMILRRTSIKTVNANLSKEISQ